MNIKDAKRAARFRGYTTFAMKGIKREVDAELARRHHVEAFAALTRELISEADLTDRQRAALASTLIDARMYARRGRAKTLHGRSLVLGPIELDMKNNVYAWTNPTSGPPILYRLRGIASLYWERVPGQ